MTGRRPRFVREQSIVFPLNHLKHMVAASSELRSSPARKLRIAVIPLHYTLDSVLGSLKR